MYVTLALHCTLRWPCNVRFVTLQLLTGLVVVLHACCAAHRFMCRDGQNRIYIYTVYNRIFGNSPAKNTVCILYIYIILANPINVCMSAQMHVRDWCPLYEWNHTGYAAALCCVLFVGLRTCERASAHCGCVSSACAHVGFAAVLSCVWGNGCWYATTIWWLLQRRAHPSSGR